MEPGQRWVPRSRFLGNTRRPKDMGTALRHCLLSVYDTNLLVFLFLRHDVAKGMLELDPKAAVCWWDPTQFAVMPLGACFDTGPLASY